MSYIQALKVYNEGARQWCNPRKGTQQHAVVMKIMRDGVMEKPQEKKEKKERKTMKVDLRKLK